MSNNSQKAQPNRLTAEMQISIWEKEKVLDADTVELFRGVSKALVKGWRCPGLADTFYHGGTTVVLTPQDDDGLNVHLTKDVYEKNGRLTTSTTDMTLSAEDTKCFNFLFRTNLNATPLIVQ